MNYFIHLVLGMEVEQIGTVISLLLIKIAFKIFSLTKTSFKTPELPVHKVSL